MGAQVKIRQLERDNGLHSGWALVDPQICGQCQTKTVMMSKVWDMAGKSQWGLVRNRVEAPFEEIVTRVGDPVPLGGCWMGASRNISAAIFFLFQGPLRSLS